MSNTWRIRRMRATDSAALRRLRLEALHDSPQAFHELYADALRYDDDTWADRARTNAEHEARAMFVAEDEVTGHWLAMMGCYVDDDRATVFAVYVTPHARGTGVSDELLAAVEDWARTAGQQVISLGVHEENLAAQRLYERHGYVDTGQRTPYPNAMDEQELVMSKPLRG